MMPDSDDYGNNSSFVVLDWETELVNTCSPDLVLETIKRLPRMARTPNTIVNIVHPLKGTLSVGVAGCGDKDNIGIVEPIACVNYISKSNDPPYLSVVGNESSPKGNSVAVFRYEQGEWTEIPLRNCVSLPVMYDIVGHFIRNGELPKWIAWEHS